MSDEILEMHAIVRGRVQGVGFRWIVVNHATPLGIKGTVRNLPDGNVEILAQSSKAILEQLVTRLKQDAGVGYVESIATEYGHPTKSYSSFTIIK